MYQKALEERLKGTEPTAAYNMNPNRNIKSGNLIQVMVSLRDAEDDEFWREILRLEKGG